MVNEKVSETVYETVSEKVHETVNEKVYATVNEKAIWMGTCLVIYWVIYLVNGTWAIGSDSMTVLDLANDSATCSATLMDSLTGPETVLDWDSWKAPETGSSKVSDLDFSMDVVMDSAWANSSEPSEIATLGLEMLGNSWAEWGTVSAAWDCTSWATQSVVSVQRTWR